MLLFKPAYIARRHFPPWCIPCVTLRHLEEYARSKIEETIGSIEKGDKKHEERVRSFSISLVNRYGAEVPARRHEEATAGSKASIQARQILVVIVGVRRSKACIAKLEVPCC